jgi:hypothetical protein
MKWRDGIRRRTVAMREVHDARIKLALLKGRLKLDRPAPFFEFLIRRIGLKDVRIEGDEIVYASFIPIETLLRESAGALDAEGVKAGACEKCGAWFDVDHDDGIFRDPAQLEGFLCRRCAEEMTAWAYFQDWLRS